MAFRLKLSDGTTTIDLHDGSDALVRDAGLSMPAPEFVSSYVGSPYYDGERLSQSRFANRLIELTLKIWGSSLSDLQTNIRSIQRLLNDARQRVLLGYGSQVYLEYQWGDTAGQSVYFDVLQGRLRLPADYFSAVLTNNYTIPSAVLSLECLPFGRYTNQDIAQATLENEDEGSNHNYQDIVTAEAYGDVPAKLYWKLAMTGATGDKKVWLAKRSGSRYDDDLWTQGEDEDSTTEIEPTVTFTDENDAALSGEKYKRALYSCGPGGLPADSEVSRLNYDIADPPRGHFRVLIFCRTTETSDAEEFAYMAWGFGYSYGDRTKTPSEDDDEYYSNGADNVLEILDLGDIYIPPIAESVIAGNNSLQLRIYQYAKEALTGKDGSYVNPTGATGATWTSPANVYDDDTGTYAQDPLGGAGWTGFLETTKAATECCGVKVFLTHGTGAAFNKVDIDAYYDDAWHDLYEGSISEGGFQNKYFSDGNHDVTKVRIRIYVTGASQCRINEVDWIAPGSAHQWDLDFIFLLPIDEGVVIIDDVNADDVIAVDGITDPPNVFILDGIGNIQDYPTCVGKPFTLGRENTRLYVLRDDVKGVTFASDVKYQPLFLVV